MQSHVRQRGEKMQHPNHPFKPEDPVRRMLKRRFKRMPVRHPRHRYTRNAFFAARVGVISAMLFGFLPAQPGAALYLLLGLVRGCVLWARRYRLEKAVKEAFAQQEQS